MSDEEDRVRMPGDRIGHYVHTYAGTPFWPCDPRPEEVDAVTIATALSRIPRYNGHTTEFYSVAEHCWHCSHLGPADEAMERLMHDAAEAYVGDMVRPIRRLALMNEFNRMEHEVSRVVALAFGLRFPWPPSVREADETMLRVEMHALIKARDKGIDCDPSRLPRVDIRCWKPTTAARKWLARMDELR